MNNVQKYTIIVISFLTIYLIVYSSKLFPIIETISFSEFFFISFDFFITTITFDFWLFYFLIKSKKGIIIKNTELYFSVLYSSIFILIMHYLLFKNFVF